MKAYQLILKLSNIFLTEALFTCRSSMWSELYSCYCCHCFWPVSWRCTFCGAN